MDPSMRQPHQGRCLVTATQWKVTPVVLRRTPAAVSVLLPFELSVFTQGFSLSL
ncbi:hypothetical protein Hanom_Chr00s086231g01796801 [Helianthus anomalus]